ncbi:MAG: hypothetical protein ACLQVD_18310 [Capsulimonadaceae bacterium]
MKLVGKIIGFVAALCLTAGISSMAKADVPAGTSVPVTLQDELFSGVQHEGDVVHFKTTSDVSVNGQVVIPAGSAVVGKVSNSHKAGCCGQPGRISFMADHVVLADGTQIPLRHDELDFRGGDNRVGSIVLCFFPGGLFWLLMNGGNGKAHVGQSFTFVTAAAPAQ